MLYGILISVLFPFSAYASDYWRDFNPQNYTTEFYNSPEKIPRPHGSCGAAAAAIVYGHLKNSWVNSNTVAYFDTKYLSPNYNTTYTTPIGDFVAKAMNENGLYAAVQTYGLTNRTGFTNAIVNTLKMGGFPVIISRHNFSSVELAHYYPVYAIHLVNYTNGAIDENNSIVYVIDSFNPYYSSSSPNYSLMYRSFNLKTVIDNSKQTYLNLIAVYNK